MNRGFTVVELLVVIVVIGILATLTMFGYQRWRQDTVKTAISADLQAAAQAMTQYRNFNNEYPSNFSAISATYTGKTTISIKSKDDAKFCLESMGTPKFYWDSTKNVASETPC